MIRTPHVNSNRIIKDYYALFTKNITESDKPNLEREKLGRFEVDEFVKILRKKILKR